MKSKFLVFILSLSGCVSTPQAECNIENVDKAKVMSNIWIEMDRRYSGHSDYCATDKKADQFSFFLKSGECRVYLPCGETNAKGETLLHGDWIITFDSENSNVKNFYDVAW